MSAWAWTNHRRVDGSGTVGMFDELMQQCGGPATEQPTLRSDADHDYALFKPKGLWVIGANGRIDLDTSKGPFIIVDLAERGASSRWTIFRASPKPDGEGFTPDILARLA